MYLTNVLTLTVGQVTNTDILQVDKCFMYDRNSNNTETLDCQEPRKPVKQNNNILEL